MDNPKMDYLLKILFWLSTIERTAIYIYLGSPWTGGQCFVNHHEFPEQS